jgi:HNH endonuclease
MEIGNMLTASRLRDVLAFEKSTGLFRWRERTSNRINVGDVAGSRRSDGFRKIVVDGRSYLSNRLAFLAVTGRWPERAVTHRNGIRSDTRWRNIRGA